MKMKIYTDKELLDFENVHTTVFELKFYEVAKNLPNMTEIDFRSIQSLKTKNKELLDLAFTAELNENR